jgi:MFS family permease
MLPVPSDNLLRSRSYIGLLLSQFLAAFNDQAIHFVAIFYAGDMVVRYVRAPHVDEKLIVTIVTACFISPFFFFSPLAGQLADKFSKRATIVFWKYAEIVITGLALLGFLLPHTAVWGWASPHALAGIGAFLVIAAVFMMGTHSAFFVPAKYGIMPEILSTSVLSRGNGLLEGTSFTANILGTAFGGFCYAQLKSKVDPTAGTLEPGHEWIIGLVLVGLAVLGTLAARLVERVPAAAPDQPLIWQPWIPLKANLDVLRTSRPLVLATVGIAFFTFMTLFVRQTLIFQGESRKDYVEYRDKRKNEKLKLDRMIKQSAMKRAAEAAADPEVDDASEKPAAPNLAGHDTALDLDAADVIPEASSSQREELRIAMLAALVGLGVGAGCAAAGMLSGDRIELGLVPIGAALMMILTATLAWVVPTAEGQSPWPTRICLLLVGVAAGLYIVPLYTLLQHRAPKESKGSLVAMSNFLNVSGGLVAIGVFYFLTFAFQSLFKLTTTGAEAAESFEKLTEYVHELSFQLQIPRLLFLAGSFITLVMLVLLCWARPDFLVRTLSWFRVPGRRRLHAVGLSNVPSNGHIILATNCHGTDQWFQVLSAIDRGSRFVRQSAGQEQRGEDTTLESLARRLRILIPAPSATSGRHWNRLVDYGAKSLEAGNLVGLALDCQSSGPQSEALLKELESRVTSDVLPVYCGASPTGHTSLHRSPWRPIVIVGKPLGSESTPEDIRAAIRALGDGSLAPDASNLKSHV